MTHTATNSPTLPYKDYIMKTLDKPLVLIVVNVVILAIGSLIVTATAATFKNVYSEQNHIREKLTSFIELDNEQDRLLEAKLDDTRERLNEFKVILHELLVEEKWQKERLGNIETIVKEIRDRSL